jgi:hypothetical protein
MYSRADSLSRVVVATALDALRAYADTDAGGAVLFDDK